ncbi:8-hydroxyquercetin 8-O-methyltransferase [Morus notabilis]|uniref:8-hydroxyquercetin 8-O-methyltransferase n=1 Tax=Morus notabilis TaxID=981085 RepID=W9QPH3_9ROSA|nr:8-hydroxyquercetin 8-O-methyltransferase [Morus notabilis]
MKNQCGDDNDHRHSVSRDSNFFYDMQMMAFLIGKQRNEAEWSKIIFDAGFGSCNNSHLWFEVSD